MTFPMNDYRVLVTGSREWDNEDLLTAKLLEVFTREVWSNRVGWQLVIVHGDCPTGADKMAKDWAERMKALGYPVTHEPHPANWKEYGKPAGFIRNAEMVDLGADEGLAFFKNSAGNKGTQDCANRAKASGIEMTEVHRP